MALTNIFGPLYGKNWSWTKLFYMYAAHSKLMFTQETKNATKLDINSVLKLQTDDLQCGDIIIGIFSFIALSAASMSSAYRVVAFLHPTSSLLLAVTRFNAKANTLLKSHNSGEMKKSILDAYSELKRLSDVYTNIWGLMALVSMLDYIVWLATDLDTGLQATNWISRASVTWYFLAILLPLMAGGEISRRVMLMNAKTEFCT